MTLSICIGTYNRISQLLPMVQEILRCPSLDFEVVVLDNVSTDGTVESLQKVAQEDSRLKVFQNEENIGGIKNPVKALTLGTGKYVMLLLDKDRIDSAYLEDFLEFLRSHELSMGYCTLNPDEYGKENRIYTTRIDSLLNTSYLSKHPSGNFYRKALLSESKELNVVFNASKLFGFYGELINAEVSTCSDFPVAVYTQPVAHMYTQEDFATQRTLTYNGFKMLYILPRNRRREWLSYANHSESLELTRKERVCVYKTIRRKFLIALETDKVYFDNPDVLSHYGLSFSQAKKGKSAFSRRANIILFYIIFLCSKSVFLRAAVLFELFFSKLKNKIGK